MTVENLLVHTEVDPNSRIAKTATRVTWTDIARNEDAYLYRDKGVDFFAADFVHELTYRQIGGAGNTAGGHIWMIANLIDDARGIDAANGDYLSIFASVGTVKAIQLEECDGGALYYSAADYDLTEGTNYFLTIMRDEGTGTYGTLYLYVYSDVQRTVLLNTQSIALHSSKKDFRYIYTIQSRNTGDAGVTFSGFVQNLDIVSGSPGVSTQPCSDVEITTATGNGTITSLGAGPVTQHGHCWNTTGSPTTADDKTTNGAVGLGAFTSSITGLSAETHYYIRAYGTNGGGTTYGGEVEIVTKESGGGKVFPALAITRVTNLIHRYNRAEAIYTLEVALGEVTSDFGLPEWLSRPRASIPETDKIKDLETTLQSPQIHKTIQDAVDSAMRQQAGLPSPASEKELTPREIWIREGAPGSFLNWWWERRRNE